MDIKFKYYENNKDFIIFTKYDDACEHSCKYLPDRQSENDLYNSSIIKINNCQIIKNNIRLKRYYNLDPIIKSNLSSNQIIFEKTSYSIKKSISFKLYGIFLFVVEFFRNFFLLKKTKQIGTQRPLRGLRSKRKYNYLQRNWHK